MCLIRSNYIFIITFGNSIKYGDILSLQVLQAASLLFSC